MKLKEKQDLYLILIIININRLFDQRLIVNKQKNTIEKYSNQVTEKRTTRTTSSTKTNRRRQQQQQQPSDLVVYCRSIPSRSITIITPRHCFN